MMRLLTQRLMLSKHRYTTIKDTQGKNGVCCSLMSLFHHTGRQKAKAKRRSKPQKPASQSGGSSKPAAQKPVEHKPADYKPVDYSKFDNIEDSDEEDDQHGSMHHHCEQCEEIHKVYHSPSRLVCTAHAPAMGGCQIHATLCIPYTA